MSSYLRLLAMLPLLRSFMLLDISMMDDGTWEVITKPEMGTRRERMQLLKRLWRSTRHHDKKTLEKLVHGVERGEYPRR